MKKFTAYFCALIILLLSILYKTSQNTAFALSVPEGPEIQAESAVLIERESGKVLYKKNADVKMYPASTTKILTALLAIENGDLDEIVTVGQEIETLPRDSSKAKLKVGEHLTLESLIMALMLPSGNDAALTIAVHIARKLSGDDTLNINDAVQKFCSLMNSRAAQIGAKNSHFVNPHGYHDENHYTTAEDLALIAREAMKNDFFRQVVSTPEFKVEDKYVFQDGNNHGEIVHDWINTNALINKLSDKYYYEYANGIKTGYTGDAGYCLVSSADRGDLSLIAVVLKSTEQARWDDSKALLDYGFNNFGYFEVLPGQFVDDIKLVNNSPDSPVSLKTVTSEGFRKILSNDDVSSIKKTIEWDSSLILAEEGSSGAELKKSISKGQVVGKVIYSLDGEKLFETNLNAYEDIKRRTFLETAVSSIDAEYIYYAAGGGVLILLIALLGKMARDIKK